MNQAQSKPIATILSSATALNYFWILNLLKATYPGIKNLLNFYPPVGPLLGLYSSSLIIMAAAYQVFKSHPLPNQKTAFLTLVTSSILFIVMVFPPIFESIAHFLQG